MKVTHRKLRCHQCKDIVQIPVGTDEWVKILCSTCGTWKVPMFWIDLTTQAWADTLDVPEGETKV